MLPRRTMIGAAVGAGSAALIVLGGVLLATAVPGGPGLSSAAGSRPPTSAPTPHPVRSPTAVPTASPALPAPAPSATPVTPVEQVVEAEPVGATEPDRSDSDVPSAAPSAPARTVEASVWSIGSAPHCSSDPGPGMVQVQVSATGGAEHAVSAVAHVDGWASAPNDVFVSMSQGAMGAVNWDVGGATWFPPSGWAGSASMTFTVTDAAGGVTTSAPAYFSWVCGSLSEWTGMRPGTLQGG